MGRIKKHLKDNKKTYIVGMSCLVAGVGIGMYKRNPELVRNSITQIASYKPHAVLEVHIEALGDPGNIIQDTTTGIIYASQGQAARELGLSPARVSEQLLGKREHINGHVFSKLGKAMVSE